MVDAFRTFHAFRRGAGAFLAIATATTTAAAATAAFLAVTRTGFRVGAGLLGARRQQFGVLGRFGMVFTTIDGFQRGGVRHGLAAFTALAAFATFLARRFHRAFCRHGALARLATFTCLAAFPRFTRLAVVAFARLAAFAVLAVLARLAGFPKFAALARFAVATSFAAFAVLTRLPRFLAFALATRRLRLASAGDGGLRVARAGLLAAAAIAVVAIAIAAALTALGLLATGRAGRRGG
ncbi:hypothetical protein, partial [Burkholderia gladioli]|uniref:hypothetical protein n=1 Tax=Burkholderia gladioli TaxID=28095 RepID=UPI0034DAFB51